MEICISPETNRRPIKARSLPVFQKIATLLLQVGISPNQVSLASMAFALVAAMALSGAPLAAGIDRVLLLIGAALSIQFRLVCNLLDGLMAVEGGFASPVGAVLNELPDRVSDFVILLAAGYAANTGSSGIELGWASALVAISTAYVRVLGGSLGLKQDFRGPLAKQQRMFTLTCASLLAIFPISVDWNQNVFTLALVVICLGGLITCIRRLVKMFDELSHA